VEHQSNYTATTASASAAAAITAAAAAAAAAVVVAVAAHRLEHLLRTCPAIDNDSADPPLDMLTTDPLQVMLYALSETVLS